MASIKLDRAAIESVAMAALPARVWRLYVSLRVLVNADGRVPHNLVNQAMQQDPKGPPTFKELLALRNVRLLEMLPDKSVQLRLREKKPRQAAKQDTGRVVGLVPLRDGEQWEVRQSFVDELTAAFPGVDVPTEIKRAIIWVESLPTRRKTRRGVKKSLMHWMSNSSKDGPAAKPAAGWPQL